jgi:hypothetical protein
VIKGSPLAQFVEHCLTMWEVPGSIPSAILNFSVIKRTLLLHNLSLYIIFSSRFSPGTLFSTTNKIDHHNITEILLKVVLNTISLNLKPKLIRIICATRKMECVIVRQAGRAVTVRQILMNVLMLLSVRTTPNVRILMDLTSVCVMMDTSIVYKSSKFCHQLHSIHGKNIS